MPRLMPWSPHPGTLVVTKMSERGMDVALSALAMPCWLLLLWQLPATPLSQSVA